MGHPISRRAVPGGVQDPTLTQTELSIGFGPDSRGFNTGAKGKLQLSRHVRRLSMIAGYFGLSHKNYYPWQSTRGSGPTARFRDDWTDGECTEQTDSLCGCPPYAVHSEERSRFPGPAQRKSSTLILIACVPGSCLHLSARCLSLRRVWRVRFTPVGSRLQDKVTIKTLRDRAR